MEGINIRDKGLKLLEFGITFKANLLQLHIHDPSNCLIRY